VWLVSGAGRGLGRALSAAVLEAGGRLVAGVRQGDALADLQARHGERLHRVPLDVRDATQAEAAVQAACERFGRLDVLVNNAGYGHMAAFEHQPADDFRDQIETNLFGVVNLTRAALPGMRARRAGRIFQVSSVGGRTATPGLSAYQAAKWAVGGFSDVVAAEVAPLGIQVCTLEPGGMRTDWGTTARQSDAAGLAGYEASVGRVLDMLAAYSGHEISDPARVAEVVLTLATRADLPRRLLLGGDALFVARQAETARAAEQLQWQDTTLSTHFPDAHLPAALGELAKGL
ncbi:MAG: short-chain dehydrogenase/reductase, partial [Azospira oryzae]